MKFVAKKKGYGDKKNIGEAWTARRALALQIKEVKMRVLWLYDDLIISADHKQSAPSLAQSFYGQQALIALKKNWLVNWTLQEFDLWSIFNLHNFYGSYKQRMSTNKIVTE